MNTKHTILLLTAMVLSITFTHTGCAPTKAIQDKAGAQLWGENCNRCHNAPSMEQYSNPQWEVIGTHMKLKANLTDEETKKIISFLQGKM